MTSQLRLLSVSGAALLSSCIYYPQGAYYQYPPRSSYPGYYGPNGSGAPGNYYRAPGPGQSPPPSPYAPSAPDGGPPPPPTPYPVGKPGAEPPIEDDAARDDKPQRDEPSPGKPSNDTPPPPSGTTDKSTTNKPTGSVPTAKRTNKPGRVKSPYPPNNELDVTGLPSGSLAKDPATGQIFRIP